MKVGWEPKRTVLLGALVLGGLWVLYSNFFSGPSSPSVSRPLPASGVSAAATPYGSSARTPVRRPASGARSGLGEFKPVLGWKRPEDRPDPSSIDPTLRLDLLAKVQKVGPEGGNRNLFQFGAASAPPVSTPLPNVGKVAINKQPAQVAQSGPAEPPKPPPPPPIDLKYYGYSTVHGSDGKKRAFFLDGEDIIVASEGDMVKRRYKVVRIGVNSVVMEDTQFKNTQTLPLTPEAVAG